MTSVVDDSALSAIPGDRCGVDMEIGCATDRIGETVCFLNLPVRSSLVHVFTGLTAVMLFLRNVLNDSPPPDKW